MTNDDLLIDFPEQTWDYLKNIKLDLVILDCTFGTVPNERDNHMNLETCNEVKERLITENIANDNCQFILTHFCHDAILINNELVPIAEKLNCIVAYDNFELEI